MPAQHRFRTYQESDPTQNVAGESVEQGGKERPISGGEPHLLAMQVSFEDHDLVAGGEDLRVLSPIAHGQ